MFSTTTSTVSFFAKEDKLRTKFQKKCHDIRQGTALLENLWNVFHQGFEMLEKYKYRFPDTVAECAVDLAETFKLTFQRCITPKDCLKYDEIFYKITPHLAQLLSTEAHVLHYRSELLNIWSEVVSKISANLVKSTFVEQTESVIIVIIQCIFFTGNYYTQLNALELVLKYIKSVDRAIQNEVLTEIMPSNELRDMLLDFRLNCFDEDSRIFLNTFNMKISDEVPVYSIVACSGDIGTLVIRKPMINTKYEQPLWIDFNSSKHTVSLFCDRKTFFPEQNSRFNNKKIWILVEIAVDSITLKEEPCLIHIKAAEKIRLVPPSFEDDIRFNLEEIKDISLQFTTKNLILIKEAKIIEYMNSKISKNVNDDHHSDTIGFNIFHQFKDQKTHQKPKEKRTNKELYLNYIPGKYNKIVSNISETVINTDNNSTDKAGLKTFDNDNFSNLKSSIVVPETTISFNSKQTSEVAIENPKHSSDENVQVNQRKHMSRRESFETTFSMKCVVKLPIINASKIPMITKKPNKVPLGKKININLVIDKTAIVEENMNPRRYALRSTSKLKTSKLNNEIEKEVVSKKNTKNDTNIEHVIVNDNLKNFYELENTEKILQQNNLKIYKTGLNNIENSTIEIEDEQKDYKSRKPIKLTQFQQKIDQKLYNEFIDFDSKVDKNPVDDIKHNESVNRKRKINSDSQTIEHSVEIHQSPKSRIGHIQPRLTVTDFPINSSLRLVNMVRPLAKDRNNSHINEIISFVPSNSLNVETEQINKTVQEYARNCGFVGITNKLKNKKNRVIYTPEELNTVFDNLKVIDTSIQRTTKKFFKTSEPERNVYDLETILKDAPQPPPKKRREKSLKRGTSVDNKKHIPKISVDNKNCNFTSHKNNIENYDEITLDSKPIETTEKKNKTNTNLHTERNGNSQVYDLAVEENAYVKEKSEFEINNVSEIPLLESQIFNRNSKKLLDEKKTTDLPQQVKIFHEEKSEEKVVSANLKPKRTMKITSIKRTKQDINEHDKKIKKGNMQKKKSTQKKMLNPNRILNDVLRSTTKNVTNNDCDNVCSKISKTKEVQITKSENKIILKNNENKIMSETREIQGLRLNTSVNKTVAQSNEKHSNISFSQKIRNLQELIEFNKKSREKNKNCIKTLGNIYKYDQKLSSQSSKGTDSKKLIINTSISTPNNLHSPINSNYNKIDDLLTEDEDEQNNNENIGDNNNEITITPNQRCDKTWLYEKFLNDIDNKNIENLNSNNSEMSIEEIRHAEPKLPELNLNHLTYTRNVSIEDNEEYPNDSVSAIVENVNNNDEVDVTPILLGQLNIDSLQLSRDHSKENIEKAYSVYTEDSPKDDSSWRSKTSSKCNTILTKNNKNVEIIETRTKTIRIEGNNHTEERRISLKRRFENNDQLDEGVVDPYNKFKHELHYIANNISEKYQNISKYPNEFNLQNDIGIFFKNYEESAKEYVESHKRMHNLRKKLKLEENNCINSLTKGIDIMEKLTNKIQKKREYFENNIDKNKGQFKQMLCNFKDSICKLRSKVWSNYMDNFVQGFVENMKKLYKLDED